MRVLSKLMADNGTRMASGLQHSELGWDLELKGDPNFPGHAGRVALEWLVERLNAAIASDPAAGNEIRAPMPGRSCSSRRAAPRSPTRSATPIPDELREERLEVIDHVDQFERTRHFALLKATKNKPGENLKQIKTREAGTHGYDKMPAEQREQAKLRDRISDNDNELNGFTSLVNMAYGALSKVSPRAARHQAGLVREDGAGARRVPRLERGQGVHRRGHGAQPANRRPAPEARDRGELAGHRDRARAQHHRHAESEAGAHAGALQQAARGGREAKADHQRRPRSTPTRNSGAASRATTATTTPDGRAL